VKPTARLPKVLLHEHLDGSLRPATVIDLAADCRYAGLPATDESALAAWFDQSGVGTLEDYLGAFRVTVGVLQTSDGLIRAAREAVEDLAADGVVYAEIRFAPSLHLRQGLSLDGAIAAVLAGLAEGEAGTGMVARLIVCAMRQERDSEEVAAAAAGSGAVGFDLAGPEAGFPATLHRRALQAAASAGLRLTIHAGEAAGPESIRDALACGAERLGHGVHVVHDTTVRSGRIAALGPIASRVHEDRIPLEICPTSNIQTLAVPSAAEHPAGILQRAGFRVTLNTDNRLMSNTSMTAEMDLARNLLGFTVDDLRAATLTAVEAAFCDEATRKAVRERVLAGFDSA
jgi:adenosine deaminase